MINHKVKTDTILRERMFTPASNGERSTRQNTGRLNVRQAFGRLEPRKNFYTVRVTKDWNDIPTVIKGQKNHGQFKKLYAC